MDELLCVSGLVSHKVVKIQIGAVPTNILLWCSSFSFSIKYQKNIKNEKKKKNTGNKNAKYLLQGVKES